jgi:hypothetical protein
MSQKFYHGIELPDNFKASATKEEMRAYLESQGLNPDELKEAHLREFIKGVEVPYTSKDNSLDKSI